VKTSGGDWASALTVAQPQSVKTNPKDDRICTAYPPEHDCASGTTRFLATTTNVDEEYAHDVTTDRCP
jgi:hypothetical protein